MHDWTATIREAMRFSAYLRQPYEVSVEEKNAYVEEVIQLLELEDLADGSSESRLFSFLGVFCFLTGLTSISQP